MEENLIFLKEYYKSTGLFDSSLLNKNFLIYNQKAKDRVDIYLMLMKTFEKKNVELINLLTIDLNEH